MSVLKITSRFSNKESGKENTADFTVTLPYEQRQKSRLRTKLDNGQDVGIILNHGQRLHHGDLLQAENGKIIEIRAATGAVSTVTANTPLLRMRACYHLGNRHVPLQISEDCFRYLQDSVLDEMIINLGLSITHENALFEPEPGAYGHSHE